MMMKNRTLALIAIAAIGAPLLVMAGCDRTVSSSKSTKTKSDGTVKTEEKTVTQSPDGTVTQEEKEKTTTPSRP